ncbi:MAG: hypothetical protein NZ551_05250 [Microscillaceae bacterium]|nr:hypothetical protein [Microscillaceae bacterium]MDW8460601.1 hypothetical protein [Cytophagales bacterium]
MLGIPMWLPGLNKYITKLITQANTTIAKPILIGYLDNKHIPIDNGIVIKPVTIPAIASRFQVLNFNISS